MKRSSAADFPWSRSQMERILAQAKQIEVMAILEMRALKALRREKSPWTVARKIRARGLIAEIDESQKVLQSVRGDLQLRLRLMTHAVLAARSYVRATQAMAAGMAPAA